MCQKPLTHDVYESRRLTEVAREKKLVTQMGIQVHSSDEYRIGGAAGAGRRDRQGQGSPYLEQQEVGRPAIRGPTRTDTPPRQLQLGPVARRRAERPFIGGGYYHPGNWRKRLDFGTGTFGDMGCHIYDPVFEALALTAPLSVRSEGPAPNAHNWANDAIVHYVFPGTKFTAGKTVGVTWYDGDQRPPQEIVAQIGKTQLPGQGSIFLGDEGGHGAAARRTCRSCCRKRQFKDYARPKLEPVEPLASVRRSGPRQRARPPPASTTPAR